MKTCSILAFDPGTTKSPVGWAWCYATQEENGYKIQNSRIGTFWATKNRKLGGQADALVLEKSVTRLLKHYSPDTMAICRPMGRYQVVLYQQGKQVGILSLLAQKQNIEIVEKPDNEFRKTLWGAAVTKQENTLKHLEETDWELTSHEADALTAAYATAKNILTIETKE